MKKSEKKPWKSGKLWKKLETILKSAVDSSTEPRGTEKSGLPQDGRHNVCRKAVRSESIDLRRFDTTRVIITS